MARVFLMIRYPRELGTVGESDWDHLLETISKVGRSARSVAMHAASRSSRVNSYYAATFSTQMRRSTRDICMRTVRTLKQFVYGNVGREVGHACVTQ